MDNFFVVITDKRTDEQVEVIGPMTESEADRVERGALINMDVYNFRIEIVEVS